MSHLSSSAQQCIERYFNLPFANFAGVRCPYFNNARLGQRGQLRALIGKGSPEEIVEEAIIVSRQYRKDMFDRNSTCCGNEQPHDHTDCIRRFLIDHNLGIDCSGFVSQVLRRHYLETKQVDIAKKLVIASARHPFRWLMSTLRPIENIDVAVFANNHNSARLERVTDLQPADMVVMLKTGPNNSRDHLLLITEKRDSILHYAHARAWSSEGRYDHGVSKGTITITNPVGNLLQQEWLENGMSGYNNETYMEAKNAQILEMRRLLV